MAKRHDYFTSALPWPQKGADVTLPLGVSAPINIPLDDTDIGVYSDASTAIRPMYPDTFS